MMSTASSEILSETQNHICRLTLNRPSKRNALTAGMYRDLAQEILQANTDSSIRVIVLQGSEGCFSAGADLAEFDQPRTTFNQSPAMQFIQAVRASEIPLVAVVDGIAVGIGATMLLHCDLVLASERARFKFPFTSLALVPEAGSSLLLPQRVGVAKAMEWLLLGNFFDAVEAWQAGLINRVFNSEQFADEVNHVISDLANKPPTAIRLTRQLLKQSQAELLDQRMIQEWQLFTRQLQSEEAKEARLAFREKRPAKF